MSNKLTNLIAGLLLIFIFFLALFSMIDDSLTMDELAHLPAGYSYLTQRDMRLNPEHPPLLKDLAALPLLFIKGIKFPSEIKDWQEDVNGQWGFGNYFLFQIGNPADKMIFWSRIPMILILVLLGFFIFKFAREIFGNKVALLSLFLFSFSPTFLAHGRLVTTDLGATAGVFIASYYFIKALQSSGKKNIILAGISFGLAELAKFSVILLIPFFIFLGFVWWLIKSGRLIKTLKILILVMVIGYILIWPVYQYHVWNYPKERQARDSEFLLSSHPIRFLAPALGWAAKIQILQPYAWYLTGLFLVFQRAAYGHTTYFLGEVSAAGWKIYFPIVYLIKEPLTFHLLTLIALFYAAWLIKKPFWVNPFVRLKDWIKNHFPEFAMLCFIGIYWLTSLTSNLNIGVRHLLPAFPFTMILVGAMTVKILKAPFLKIKYLILAGLILWQAFSVLAIYPHFLTYFNELAGGPNQGFLYVVNSNLDWGQDLKRLKKWADENKIEKIYLDYFGGSDARYYLNPVRDYKDNEKAQKEQISNGVKEKYLPWRGDRDPKELPKGSYLAISATFLQGGRGIAVPGHSQPTGYYRWLWQYQPITKIGYSIFVYYIE